MDTTKASLRAPLVPPELRLPLHCSGKPTGSVMPPLRAVSEQATTLRVGSHDPVGLNPLTPKARAENCNETVSGELVVTVPHQVACTAPKTSKTDSAGKKTSIQESGYTKSYLAGAINLQWTQQKSLLSSKQQ